MNIKKISKNICLLILFVACMVAGAGYLYEPITETSHTVTLNKEIQDKVIKSSEKPYLVVKEQYPDIEYWIKIREKGAKSDEYFVDQPVMKNNNGFYLTHAYDGTPSKSGALFFDPKTNFIYGHHMKNGTMFGQLESKRDDIDTIQIDKVYPDGSYSRKMYKVRYYCWWNADEKENDFDYKINISLVTCSYGDNDRFSLELDEI